MNDQIKAVRESASSELLNLGCEVNKLSEALKGRTWSRLASVMRTPPEDVKQPGTVAENYPPLFQEIRGIFWEIQRNLNSINEALDLVEL